MLPIGFTCSTTVCIVWGLYHRKRAASLDERGPLDDDGVTKLARIRVSNSEVLRCLPQENGDRANVEVNEVLRFCWVSC